MNSQQIVIVGAGQGGFQMAASLRQDGFLGSITLIGEEPGLPYQRPPLSKAFLGDGNATKLQLRQQSFYDKHTIKLLPELRIKHIDRDVKTVTSSCGKSINYDHLILATGSRNLAPPINGLGLQGVLSLRTMADAQLLRQHLETMSRVVVIGGGFIGLEFAAVASNKNIQVTVLEGESRLMPRAVSEPISDAFAQAHRSWGNDIRLSQYANAILDDGNGAVAGVQTSDGSTVPCDAVIVAAGVVANSELAEEAGLRVENGIAVDEFLQTSDPDISALGDCCQFPEPISGSRMRLESVQAATDHARTISKRLVGTSLPYVAVPWFWSNQRDLKLQIAGLADKSDASWVTVTNKDKQLVVMRFTGDVLTCVESINSAVDHMSARKLLASDIKINRQMLADQNYCLKAMAKGL